MSDHAVKDAPAHDPAAHAAEHPYQEVPGFDQDDVRQFQADDAEAVTNIGKLLVAFFFYSLIVVITVSWLAAIAWF